MGLEARQEADARCRRQRKRQGCRSQAFEIAWTTLGTPCAVAAVYAIHLHDCCCTSPVPKPLLRLDPDAGNLPNPPAALPRSNLSCPHLRDRHPTLRSRSTPSAPRTARRSPQCTPNIASKVLASPRQTRPKRPCAYPKSRSQKRSPPTRRASNKHLKARGPRPLSASRGSQAQCRLSCQAKSHPGHYKRALPKPRTHRENAAVKPLPNLQHSGLRPSLSAVFGGRGEWTHRSEPGRCRTTHDVAWSRACPSKCDLGPAA